MNIERIREIAKQSMDISTSTTSTDSYDSPEDEPIDIFAVLEISPITHDVKVLHLTRDQNQARCFLLDYIKDIEKENYNCKRQLVIENEDRIELFVRGIIYGKTLNKVFKICKYSH
jgi:hypothetical protein